MQRYENAFRRDDDTCPHPVEDYFPWGMCIVDIRLITSKSPHTTIARSEYQRVERKEHNKTKQLKAFLQGQIRFPDHLSLRLSTYA